MCTSGGKPDKGKATSHVASDITMYNRLKKRTSCENLLKLSESRNANAISENVNLGKDKR